MKTYLVEFKGGEGCDYSIGCGIKTVIMEATDLNDLTSRIHNEYSGWDEEGVSHRLYMKQTAVSRDDWRFERIYVHEITNTFDITEALCVKINHDKLLAKEQGEKLAKETEKKLYEELAKKYGNATNP